MWEGLGGSGAQSRPGLFVSSGRPPAGCPAPGLYHRRHRESHWWVFRAVVFHPVSACFLFLFSEKCCPFLMWLWTSWPEGPSRPGGLCAGMSWCRHAGLSPLPGPAPPASRPLLLTMSLLLPPRPGHVSVFRLHHCEGHTCWKPGLVPRKLAGPQPWSVL